MSDDKPDGNNNSQPGLWSRIWRQPRRRWLLGIPLGGLLAFLVGIMFWGGFNTALEHTESLAFCTSCHDMQVPFEEYKQSIHYTNEAGVRAVCSDCHVPEGTFARIWRHVKASKEVWSHFTGKIGTPEKYEKHRAEMAAKVEAEMRADNSAGCRKCHSWDAMKLSEQGHQAAKKHSPAWRERTGDTCIDCHKDVAHHLPKPSEL
ncbi:MAG: NapC/NirT family cytochrome c [Gammaproteobacteria bacterium]|jgi:nitrate/TMAO reductase-like tetraheme cytochrome c subunit